MECSVIKKLGRRVEINEERLRKNSQQGRKKTKLAQAGTSWKPVKRSASGETE